MTRRHAGAASLREFAVLCLGALAGYALAWWLHGFGFADPGELAAAREAGIVSRTTLAGYAKSRDLYNALIALALPVAAAAALWWGAGVRSALGSHFLQGGFVPHGFAAWLYWPLVVAIAVASWHTNAVTATPWSDYAGAWYYLGEQGATLAWVHSLGTGGVFGRDFFSLYGPMFVYPLRWLMDLWGDDSALVERYYKYILQIGAFALLTFLLLRTLRLRLLALALAIVIAAAYPALIPPSANTSLLRTALSLFALGAVALWIDTRAERWRWIGGLALGQALLFAHEAAIPAAGACLLLLYADGLLRGTGHGAALRACLAFVAIGLLSMTPMLVYLLASGAGAALLDSLIGYPRLVLLGFGGQPFPSLRDWLPGHPAEHAIHYAVLALYSASALATGLAWAKGTRSPRLLWAAGLTLFGLALFRQALGRSAAEQTLKVALPALFLAALWLDAAWGRVVRWREAPAAALVPALCAAGVVAALAGIGLDDELRFRMGTAWRIATWWEHKFATPQELLSGPVHPRVGFPLDPQTQASIGEIDELLERHARPGEPVYFFPNEAAYYHLFRRTNPTRYVLGYFAPSFERQREVIRDLDARRVRLVVFSPRTWRVDDIPETVQIPLIVDYLRQNYRLLAAGRSVDLYLRESPDDGQAADPAKH